MDGGDIGDDIGDGGGIADVFRAAGCDGWLCALDVDGPGEVAHGADTVVVAASVFKVLVALEFFRRVGAGDLDGGERVRLGPAGRTPGATGFSTFADEVDVSLRDLVRMMLVVSDNAATDVVLDRVGLAAVNRTAASLGLAATVVQEPLRTVIASIATDAGFADWDDLQAATGPDAPPEFVAEVRRRLATVRALVAERTIRTTARDMATLLRLIWRDEAGRPVRDLMAAQVTRHRLATAFDPDVRVAAKTGSLLGVVRNEIGVVTYPDGGRYAVAVFTRAHEPYHGENEIDRAIGAAAATAIARLRATPPPGRLTGA
jgi:beta-lactamase class A